MFAAIDDVHHRDGQGPRRGATHVAIKRLHREIGGGLCRGQRHTEDRVRAKPTLVRRAVKLDHRLVHGDLFGRVEPQKRVGDFAIHGLDGGQHALAHVATLVAVAPFDGFVGACGGAGGHRGAAHAAVFEGHINFNRRVAAAVEYLAGVNIDDGAHGAVLCWAGGANISRAAIPWMLPVGKRVSLSEEHIGPR